MSEFSVRADCSKCGGAVVLTWADVQEKYRTGPILCDACVSRPCADHAPAVTLDELDASGAVVGVKFPI